MSIKKRPQPFIFKDFSHFRYSLDEKNNPLGGLSIKSQSFKLLYVTKVQTGDVKPVFDMGSFSE